MSSRKLNLRLPDHSGIWDICRAVIEALGWSSLYPVAPRLCLIGFNLSQPLLIKAILKHLQDARTKDVAHGKENFMILGTVLVYVGIAISGSIYWQLHLRNLTKIRGILVGAVYKKLTTVTSAQAENSAVTLMSTDVERVTQGLRVFHEAWANLVEVAMAVWLLQRELHIGSIAPVAIAIACFLVTLCVNKFTMSRQNRWMEALQARINRTVSVLSQIKTIRMLGLGEQSHQALDALRVSELRLANEFRMIMVFSFCIAFAPIFIVPVACFAIYLSASQNGNTFDVAKAFTSLSLVVILTQPLSSLFQYVPMFAGAANCLQRINDFLHSPSHCDPRERSSDTTRERSGTQDDYSEAETSTAVVEITERNTTAEEFLSIYDGAFGWSENHWDLHNVNISIPKSQLTVITGAVASGKSTLCKAFLGEVPYVKGIVKISSGADIGFCDQTPYLTNTTIYENIIGKSVVDDAWYKTVVRAADLEADFERLSSGDRTLVGNNGDALSAGQKQRVALARAVYARKPLIILDDVFSGMDNATTGRIFKRLLSPDGLLHHLKTTVILARPDQDVRLAADLVVELASDRPPVSSRPIRQEEPERREADSLSEINDAPDTMHTKQERSASQASIKPWAYCSCSGLSQMLRSVVIGWTLMETSITAVSRIKEFEQTTPRENDLNSEGAITHGPVSGKIEYKNLTVSYGPSNENLALKNVNLVIEAGQKVGICGRSGSGKSSLIASLFRLLDVREGKLVIDSTDISDYSLSKLRSSINVIPQDPFVTSGTFREVLDPYEASPDHAIEEALHKVKLFDYVQSHEGLGGNVKPESLSQGQKQLLSLARAILRRCRIVVLDEVTSRLTRFADNSLDLETEQLMWGVLQEEFRGCTIIAIAHRLETIVEFDRVAVMDEGNIIEFDDPRVLLEDTNSAFSKLRRMGKGH
ncbi:ABC multidrug transporter [Colletotrichum camelliae]|nr:ABC multidrug transporter [Colletotrichum camelliae]